jgi:hypothetical protein
VYSMTTAPCAFIIRRRKSDSMTTPMTLASDDEALLVVTNGT